MPAMDALLKKYFWVVNLVVIAVCAIFAGKAAAHFIVGAVLSSDDARPSARRSGAGQQPAKVHGKETDEIIKRNLFCSGCAPIVKVADASDGPQSNEPQKSSLQLELVSTMFCPDDDTWSMAVIRDLSTKEKDPAMYNRGKNIGESGAVVHKVLPRRVYLKNGGRLEYLELDGAAAPPASTQPAVASLPPPPSGMDPNMGDIDKGVTCTGNQCNVERQLVEKMLQNTAMLATAARFVPSIKDGKPNGFKLYAIRPNSIFGKIGLQNGDTVKAINGLDMSTPDKALEVYTKLRNASHLTVQVERRGESLTLDYTIR
jgi:general secretion pathway protein C